MLWWDVFFLWGSVGPYTDAQNQSTILSDCNTSKSMRRIFIKFCKDVHCLNGINPTGFGDPHAINLVSPEGQLFSFLVNVSSIN